MAITKDPLFPTYLMIGGLGFIAALLVVVLVVLIFRGGPGNGVAGLAAAREYIMGKKTYILAAALMALGYAKTKGYIDAATYEQYSEFILGGAIMTYRAAMGRVEARLKQITLPVEPAPEPETAPVVAAVLTPAPPPWPVPNAGGQVGSSPGLPR